MPRIALVATGRAPNIDGLDVVRAGFHAGPHGVVVDDRLRTSNRRVYAAGDVCSRFQFTHVADATARIVIQNALFFGRKRASALRARVDGETMLRERTMAHTVGKPSLSWVVLLGAGLAIASALVIVAGPVGYRLGILSLRVALLTFLRWGVYGGIAAAVVSLAGFVVTLTRPKEARRGILVAAISLLVGVVLIGIPGRFRLGPPTPPIHDITTDTQEPPEYVAVLPLRVNAPNTTVYGGERIASQQREAYPELQPLMLSVPPPQAFERALATVREMGWALVAADAAAGRIEATDTTFWYGFKDDVVIRVRSADGGSRVDVRSLSRVGGGDAGTNAKRIRGYLDALTAR